MSHVFGRATLRFAPVVRTRPTTSLPRLLRRRSGLARPGAPFALIQSQPRLFTTSPLRLDGESDHKPEDLVARARSQEQRIFTKGTSAQRLENDRPWHREDSHAQPASTSPDPSRGDLSKGRLLTTPTRLLKLILPMPFHPEQQHINDPIQQDEDEKRKTVEPLALLIHPQQPLSYLERLIQAEIPPLEYKGREKLPDIVFRAEADQEETQPKEDRTNVASYSGLGHEGPDRSNAKWVRWSGSTEVGDFIRDAARGREFAVAIEGFERELRVAVPSFKDRTHYMRSTLRRMSREIDAMAKIKSECDAIAHKGAHRLAQGGFAALASWWAVVYYTSFHTEMGWDLVEPVTYLAGLTTIMGGYLWFLYISRDLSYKAAMKITVTKRQNALYQERGFDPTRWEQLVHEANALRRDVRAAAAEYDVEWDETRDLGGEEVKEILEKEADGKGSKEKKKKRIKKEEEEEEDDDDSEEAKTGAMAASSEPNKTSKE